MLSEHTTRTLQSTMLSVGLTLLFIAATAPLLGSEWSGWRYVYTAGAVLILAERLTERYHGNNLRLRRLYFLGKASAALYCASAACFFYPNAGRTDWLAFLIAGVAVQTYVSFVTPAVEKKEREKENDNNAKKQAE